LKTDQKAGRGEKNKKKGGNTVGKNVNGALEKDKGKRRSIKFKDTGPDSPVNLDPKKKRKPKTAERKKKKKVSQGIRKDVP